MMPINIICCSELHTLVARNIAKALSVEVLRTVPNSEGYSLVFEDRGVSLLSNSAMHGPIYVDFCTGGSAHRRQYGGGKGQLIAKAVGISPKNKPLVLDMTAGLGGDGFVLASLGCRLTLLEQSPIVFSLLDDGIKRAREQARDNDDNTLFDIVSRMNVVHSSAQQWYGSNRDTAYDVVYLDPMFPPRQKSAAVKKEMSAFHAILKPAQDEAELLEVAQRVASKRVVVKRPKLAEHVAGKVPIHIYKGKSSRFDIYPPLAF